MLLKSKPIILNLHFPIPWQRTPSEGGYATEKKKKVTLVLPF